MSDCLGTGRNLYVFGRDLVKVKEPCVMQMTLVVK